MTELTGFSGILFIGDPHLASQRVGRRQDDYATAILSKLSQSAKIAKERNLYPVILGDLFHRAGEHNLELLAKTMEVARQFTVPPVVLAGSHDRTESWFTDKDAASLLSSAGVIRLVEHTGNVVSLRCKDTQVTLWASPAGDVMPTELSADPGSFNIMVTHHDIDFRGMYPGAQELKAIKGCDMLVNGHMHTPTPSVLKGNMNCHNPGSIARVTVDLLTHRPAVSVWTPAHGLSLERVELTYADDVFNLTGTEVSAATPKELKDSMVKGLRLSSFASRLRGSASLETGRTEDGSVLVEEIQAYFTLFEKPPVLRSYISNLLNSVLTEKP